MDEKPEKEIKDIDVENLDVNSPAQSAVDILKILSRASAAHERKIALLEHNLELTRGEVNRLKDVLKHVKPPQIDSPKNPPAGLN